MPSFFEQRVVRPLTGLLQVGATPRRLAWSIAIGLVIGVNPLLGSTTLIALGLASVLRLNVVASQIGNHVVYPLEIALFPVFVKLGSWLFGTPGLPLSPHQLAAAVKAEPWHTTRALWTWEWHALVVWGALALVVAPVLAMLIRPGLERMLQGMAQAPVLD